MWVITTFSWYSINHDLYISILTDVPAHVYLLLSFHQPSARPRIVRQRGQEVVCGWYLHWDSAFCTNQQETPPSLMHSYTFLGLPYNEPFWFWFADWCLPGPGIQTSAVFQGMIIPPPAPSVCKVVLTRNTLNQPKAPQASLAIAVTVGQV